jgi:hypothetical protein
MDAFAFSTSFPEETPK